MLHPIHVCSAAAAILMLSLALACAKGPVYTDPDNVDVDFAIQGEYTGDLVTESETEKIGVQVIALGNGRFRAVGYPGGLPGDGWDTSEKEEAAAESEAGIVTFQGDDGTATIRDGVMLIHNNDGQDSGKLQRVVRESPTLGKQPPAGAVVLFDGTSAENFKNGRMTGDGLLTPGITSRQTFGSHHLHVEFRLPYQPEDHGQARGNSGLYVQGRYEIQILDSYGLKGRDNECGGIYSVQAPAVNMCFPPLSWQTYDVEFTAARYDGDGQLVENPRITVLHNGVMIHEDLELPGDRVTPGGPSDAGPHPGPVFLQDHGNPVRYRNIWAVNK